MKKTALTILLSLLGAAEAAPLEFYIMSDTGISPYETPVVNRWMRFDAAVAPRWLERERQKLDSAREKLQNH